MGILFFDWGLGSCTCTCMHVCMATEWCFSLLDFTLKGMIVSTCSIVFLFCPLGAPALPGCGDIFFLEGLIEWLGRCV